MFKKALGNVILCIVNSFTIKFSPKFFHQLIHKRIALKGILKFILKQLQHVSVRSPSSGSALFDLAKFTVVTIVN